MDDATITPEQAQANLSAEDTNPQVEETPQENPGEPTPEPEQEPVKEPEPLPDKKPLSRLYKEKKAELREKNVEVESLREENQHLKNELAGKPKAEVSEDIAEFAESIDADPEAIEKLAKFIEKRNGKKDAPDVSKEDIEFVKQFRAEQAKKADQENFLSEWNDFLPSLKAEFPTASDAELTSIRKEVDKLAHTPEFHDKELDYIYFKSKKTLSALVSPRRASAESTNATQVVESGKPVELSGRSSPMDVQNALQNSRNAESLEIRSMK